MSSLFKLIGEISEGKKQDDISAYVPFIVTRYFSFFPDTLYFANEMNMNTDLREKDQYSFFINTIRPRKRYHKWLKKDNDEAYNMVRKHYGYNDRKAKAALKVLSKDQLNTIIKIEKEKEGVLK